MLALGAQPGCKVVALEPWLQAAPLRVKLRAELSLARAEMPAQRALLGVLVCSMQQLWRAVSSPLMSDGSTVYRSAPPQPSNAELAPSPTLKLVAVTAARIVDGASKPIALDADSAIDLTAMVTNGMLQWTAPAGQWLVFGFWQRATGQTANGFPPFQEPSVWSSQTPSQGFGLYFMADIFSDLGIASALAPLARLPRDTLDLLSGTQFAHDSHEVQAEMFWTGKLPDEFEARRGYSVIKYLPALHAPKESSFDPLTEGWGTKPPLVPEYTFTNDVGPRVRYDYHLTLNDLYVERYLGTFTRTLNEHGMSSRAQVAYNYLPLNMTRAGAAVDIPENESLDSGWTKANDTTVPMYGTERWRHALDSYRLTGSGAHLNKGKRATIEFGDDFAIYRKQPIDYAAQLNEACAGGITLGLLTGFAGVSSAWPGGSGLAGIGIGDFWTTAWPQWRDWAPLAEYFARSTLLLESGKPRIDVVIYLDEGIAGVHELTTPKFASDTLERAGFSYDFIDPVSLSSERAQELPATLFGAGPAYRALVLNKSQRLPVKAAEAISSAAKGGLRVVLVGAPPTLSTGLADAALNDMLVAMSMQELVTLENVVQVQDEGSVATALIELGVLPDARFGDSCAIMSVHRVSDQGEDIYWLFNPSSEELHVMGDFAVDGARASTPYQLDLWNGTHARVAQWEAREGRIQMPVAIPARSTTAFMFQHQTAPLHVTATDAQGAEYSNEGQLVLFDAQGGAKHVSLSDGSMHSVQLAAPPAPLRVQNYQLVVDEISPTGNSKHTLQLQELADWRDIPELRSAVGSGTYSASFEVPEAWLGTDFDLVLTVGDVAGAMQLELNGQLVTKQTTPGGKWTVKSLLKAGSNAIEVRIDTTLINRVSASAGNTGEQDTQPSGLIGPVQLTPVSVAMIPRDDE
ncbi:MAG TPA: glycosyl hydrolase [Polyangiales bacterium]|nr:glycosyl hydrolase [Polyangiales bacterium]